jgi:hypothetical protein
MTPAKVTLRPMSRDVFGTNAVARHLYEAAGYSVANIEMYKEF